MVPPHCPHSRASASHCNDHLSHTCTSISPNPISQRARYLTPLLSSASLTVVTSLTYIVYPPSLVPRAAAAPPKALGQCVSADPPILSAWYSHPTATRPSYNRAILSISLQRAASLLSRHRQVGPHPVASPSRRHIQPIHIHLLRHSAPLVFRFDLI